jgi:hypothetical protein
MTLPEQRGTHDNICLPWFASELREISFAWTASPDFSPDVLTLLATRFYLSISDPNPEIKKYCQECRYGMETTAGQP